eukprot:UN02498
MYMKHGYSLKAARMRAWGQWGTLIAEESIIPNAEQTKTIYDICNENWPIYPKGDGVICIDKMGLKPIV